MRELSSEPTGSRPSRTYAACAGMKSIRTIGNTAARRMDAIVRRPTLELHPRWVYARAVISIHSWSVIEEGWGNGGDPYAATRRAIIRAAAEIGRAMP